MKGRPQSYDSYVREYKKLKESMNKKGYHMASKMYSKSEWERLHLAMKNDRQKEINLGRRKLVGNVNRDIAKMQQWEYSAKQAHAMQKVIKNQTGKMPLIKDVRSGKSQIDWVKLEEKREELLSEGKSEADVQSEIWGSP